MRKIQELVEQIQDISIEDRESSSVIEISRIEDEIGCKIPDDYKYFSQRLGTGCAANFVNLYCINYKYLHGSSSLMMNLAELVGELLKTIENNDIGNNSVSEQPPPEWTESEIVKCLTDWKEMGNEHIEIIKNGLMFGDFNSDRVIFWDLRTYRHEDDSYDIYWYDRYTHSVLEKPILIGRSFTDFLSNFCYGQLPCQLIPNFCGNSNTRKVESSFYSFREEGTGSPIYDQHGNILVAARLSNYFWGEE